MKNDQFLTADQKLMQAIGGFVEDPLGYVMFMFPWDTDPTIQKVELAEPWKSKYNCKYGPDAWACEFLDDLGKHIRERNKILSSGSDATNPISFSTASGHGIGKSTLVAWLVKYLLDCKSFTKGVVTANTSEQLRTKTWAEVAKWNALSLSAHLWVYTNARGNMALYRKGPHEISTEWRCDAMTCREENSESFQGLHSAHGYSFFIFDEASGIPSKIWEARSGAATDKEHFTFDFGNPTRKSGHFFENCMGKFAHRNRVRFIDSRSVQITSKGIFERWAEDWGEDSDFFKVKVKGEFPSSGTVQFIDSDLVKEAQYREGVHNEKDPLIIGVDVARYGDNATVIFPRIGRDCKSFPYKEYRGLDTVQVAEKVIDMIKEFSLIGRKVDALFIDAGGLGGGVYDFLNRAGYNPIDVNFGSRSTDRRYARKGDEMWGRLRDDLQYLALPNNSDIYDELTQREYGFNMGGAIQLEKKEDMADRGAKSPDHADALALTYYTDVAANLLLETNYTMPMFTKWDYDPLEGRD